MRKYKGKFTDKMVKPIEGQTNKGFVKNASVIILDADDYKEYSYVIKKINVTWKNGNIDDIKELREIDHIKFKNSKLN